MEHQDETYDDFNGNTPITPQQSIDTNNTNPSRPHSLSSVVDVDHPNHPQPQDYYMPLCTRLPTKKAMVYVPVTFINSNRSTFSDVMTISNSARVKKEKRSKFNTSHRVRFPYDDSNPFKAMAKGIDQKHTTMLERQLQGETRSRRNKELHNERAVFMERLAAEREGRAYIESGACVVIQRITRG